MGFSIRKSVRVGPVRFNLSQSGIGMSAGIKGLRVGTGPRGNYIHMGRGGLYYRAALSSGQSAARTIPPPTPNAPPSSVETMTEIESGSVLQMTDSSSEGVLRELNDKRRKWRFWPWVLVASFLLPWPLSNFGATEQTIGVVMLLGIGLTALIAYWDRIRRTSVLLYDMENDAQGRYQQLHDAFDALATNAAMWHHSAQGATRDWKRNAGAGTLVRRNRIGVTKTLPSTVKTNIEVPSVPVGRQLLCFFPDRMLVFDRAGVGAVSYADLKVDVRTSRFIESEAVPSDAQTVGTTWKYLNKKGGPDKRFKDNRQLPICLYEEIAFTSTTGLNEIIQTSKCGVGPALASAVLAQVSTDDVTKSA